MIEQQTWSRCAHEDQTHVDDDLNPTANTPVATSTKSRERPTPASPGRVRPVEEPAPTRRARPSHRAGHKRPTDAPSGHRGRAREGTRGGDRDPLTLEPGLQRRGRRPPRPEAGARDRDRWRNGPEDRRDRRRGGGSWAGRPLRVALRSGERWPDLDPDDWRR
ncbi:hypothetical protein C2845_PM08G20860 [Panicum miliaceum]|uniref:Uncharacterized protein n=1 Tax=Panicum miliaceum TaxID=4540 RepID=A0A3L6R3Z6_PANMI|nr:hypothetical protein C2845_PM08G20860 [Panicum miliaceum]